MSEAIRSTAFNNQRQAGGAVGDPAIIEEHSCKDGATERAGSMRDGSSKLVETPPDVRRPSMFWRRFHQRKLSVAGVVLLGVFVVIAIFAPFLSPYSPTQVSMEAVSSPPTTEHWLGTDRIGRDIWTRMLYGARVSLAVSVAAVVLSLTIGVTLGSIAGFVGGFTDSIIMRFTDAVMCFPTLLLIITLAAILPPSVYNIIFILGLFGWPGLCRLVRAQFLSLRNQDFVMAAQCIGASRKRIIFRHILPQAMVPILVYGILEMAAFIIAEAGLSFLGFGVREPMPSWGQMMSVAMQLPILEFQWWMWLPPAVAIALTVLAVNFVGDGLMYAMDPRLSRRR